MMKETFYFPHDYNARTDDKVKRLIRKHGMSGYGIFWSIIEDLYNNNNSLIYDCEGIAYELRTDEKTIDSILNEFDLFVKDGDSFGSISVQKRLEARDEKSRKARENARKRWDNKQTESDVNANALQTDSDSNAIKERKGKERKGKKKEEEKNIPTLDEFLKYALSHIGTLDRKIVELKYNAWVVDDWKDGYGNPIKNWKSKLLNTIPHLQNLQKKSAQDNIPKPPRLNLL